MSVTQDGRNALLQINFAKRPIIELWYIALYTDPLTEFVDYTGSRALWTPISYIPDMIKGLTETPIIPTLSGTILAVGLHSTDVKGSTSDLKAHYSELSVPFNVVAGKPISVIYTVGWD